MRLTTRDLRFLVLVAALCLLVPGAALAQQYPAAIPTWADLPSLGNSLQCATLSTGAVADSVTVPFTLNVADTSCFAASNGVLVIGANGNREEMRYDTKTSTSFNIVERGRQTGGALSHDSGVDVFVPIPTGLISNLIDELLAALGELGEDPSGSEATVVARFDALDTSLSTSAGLAALLSDETGSGGGFVRAASPTLTTPDLGTPSALVLTNATGLPEAQVTQHEGAIDHGSIAGLGDDDHTQYVLADGSRAFTGPILAADGTAGATGVGFAGDAGEGLYRIGANRWGLASSGVNALDINGGQSYLAAGAGFQFLAIDGTASLPGQSFGNDRDSGFYRRGSDEISMSLGGAEKFRFNAGAGYAGVSWRPLTDNAVELGSTSYRWSSFYAGTNITVGGTWAGSGGGTAAIRVPDVGSAVGFYTTGTDWIGLGVQNTTEIGFGRGAAWPSAFQPTLGLKMTSTTITATGGLTLTPANDLTLSPGSGSAFVPAATEFNVGSDGAGAYQFIVGGGWTSSGASTVAGLARINGPLVGAAGDTGRLFGLDVSPSITTQGAGETITDVATVWLYEPVITVGAGDTITTASTLHIENGPSEGVNNYALFVDAGDARFDGAISVQPGNAVYLDNFGHTYIKEQVANYVRIVGGGNVAVDFGSINYSYAGFYPGTDNAHALGGASYRWSDIWTGRVTMSAAGRLYFDGGGNTYMTEAASDDLRIVLGGANILRFLVDRMRLDTQAHSSAAPSSPSLGDFYIDTDSNELCFYDGTSWTGIKAGGACS